VCAPEPHQQLASNLEYVDIARKEGGRAAFGCQTLQRETPGFYHGRR